MSENKKTERSLVDRVKELSADQLLELKKALREIEAPLKEEPPSDDAEWEEYEEMVRTAQAANLEVALISGRIARKRMRRAVPLGWEAATEQMPVYTSLVVCGYMAPRPYLGLGGTDFGIHCGGSGGTEFGVRCPGGSGGTDFGVRCGGSGGTEFGVRCPGGSGGTDFGVRCGGSGGTDFGVRCGGSGGTEFGVNCGGR